MMKFALLLIAALAAVSTADEDFGLCCLCGKGCGYPVTNRGDMFVNNKGLTCNDLVLWMSDTTGTIKQGNGQCTSLKAQHYSRCCDASSNPSIIAQNGGGNGATEADRYPVGNYPQCDLCADGMYPTKPTTQVAVLDHPRVGTCRDLYHHTNRGMFEDRMCRPIRNFYKVHCCPAAVATSDGGNNGGNNGGNGGTNTGGTTNGGEPDKKEVSVDTTKDDNRMYQEGGNTKRGGLDRHRGLRKGSTTKH
jgi:hypothetical protein